MCVRTFNSENACYVTARLIKEARPGRAVLEDIVMKKLAILILISLSLTMTQALAKKGGKPGTDVPVTYTAELTSEGDVFAPVTLENLTAHSRGTALSGDFDISMSQLKTVDIFDDEGDPVLDDQGDPVGPVFIFNYHCPDLVSYGDVDFDVVAGNWGIAYIRQKDGPGHVYIVMRNLLVSSSSLLNEYRNPDFDFDLHGDVILIDDEDVLFPPEEGKPSVFYLTHYKLWAGVGGKGGFVCNSIGRPYIDPIVKLEITRNP
jgi:hypothetical protein